MTLGECAGLAEPALCPKGDRHQRAAGRSRVGEHVGDPCCGAGWICSDKAVVRAARVGHW